MQWRQEYNPSFMELALAQAQIPTNDVPIGAVIVLDGSVIASAHNEREARNDPTAHAEILAITRASAALNSWHLNECDLYVTLEPCLMCAGAIINSRIRGVYFGPFDPKAGAMGSLYGVGSDPRLNHECFVWGGNFEKESIELLKEFFSARRS
ncbi:tRNA-specific adenosine deaminase [Acidithrix ferrooxidans]|uniref:tRNA-specific adenosine deaminase n=1 Tax=Acidithrix ferrooxidans TaxID=1280514 RepID=A0A0D8HD86_9ACTN|nr:nucleoside deaminase [Acidithrix ferrooxidans]KJF15910.1 tRNA-specific adenosine deaminase [Acidithrix ferrooxidans]CAG4916529.1 unnamed protein product [Acidithrix sp. C25]